MPRLFVAVWPPAEVVERLASLDRPAAAGLRWTAARQWHVTLRFMGSVPGDEVADLRAAVGAAVAGVGPVAATVGPVVGRFGRRVLQVPVAGLEDLATAVVDATAGFGESPEERAFSGHLTLARAKGRGIDLRALTGAPVAGEWSVGEVTLVESSLRREGATYEVVGRFAVGSAP